MMEVQRLKLYVIVEVYDVIVQGVHVLRTWREVEAWAKRELMDSEYQKWFLEGGGEPPVSSHYDETKVFEVYLELEEEVGR